MHLSSIKKLACGLFLTFSTVCAVADPNAVITTAPTTNSMPITNVTAITPAPPDLPDAKSYVLMDANSGAVLASKNMNDRLPPASLTKLMTLYVAMGALKQGQIHLTDPVLISEKAWRMSGSRMFVQVGTQVPLQDLINGIIIASGNDACVAVAEHVAGTEDVFAQLMDENAARLGMHNTHYIDSTGLPSPYHYSSAYDLGLLARAIITDFPDYYTWFNQKWMVYNNIRQPNRDRLMWRDPSVDGLKTGHTDEAGYCLVSSALRSNQRLIAVVLGAPSDNARTDDSQALLNWGFRFFESHKLFNAQQPINQKNQPRVWFGKSKYAKLGFTHDIVVSIPTGQFSKLQANVQTEPELNAPVIKGQQYGSVILTLDGKQVASVPIVALEEDPKAGFFMRIIDHISMWFSSWFRFHHNEQQQ